jgi:hypothetical protein
MSARRERMDTQGHVHPVRVPIYEPRRVEVHPEVPREQHQREENDRGEGEPPPVNA